MICGWGVWGGEAKVGWSSKTGLFQNGNDDWFELAMKILWGLRGEVVLYWELPSWA